MKKICIVFGVLFILILTAAVTIREADPQASAYLRMHVRANSDSMEDQAVKYEVKDAIVQFLIPVAAECESKAEAMDALEENLAAIEEVADEVLAKKGFSYRARARVCREKFPDRVYEGVTLQAGIYDALIVELGTGSGANWWCVVYPPLCFSGEAKGDTIRYRSRLLELIGNFFAN